MAKWKNMGTMFPEHEFNSNQETKEIFSWITGSCLGCLRKSEITGEKLWRNFVKNPAGGQFFLFIIMAWLILF